MNNSWLHGLVGGIAGALLTVGALYGLAVSGNLGFLGAKGPGGEMVRDYLVAHPEMLIVMNNKLMQEQAEAQEAERQDAIRKVGLKAFFDPKIAYVEGPENAKNTMVEFFDYNCPYCRASVPAIKKYMAAHKDTRYAFIEWAIKGPESVAAAKAAIAARKQGKYLEFHFALMEMEGLITAERVTEAAQKAGLDVKRLAADMNTPEVQHAIDAAHKLADQAKIDGTPTFIIDGKVRSGALTEEELKDLTKG